MIAAKEGAMFTNWYGMGEARRKKAQPRASTGATRVEVKGSGRSFRPSEATQRRDQINERTEHSQFAARYISA